jgi:YcxB-like protein
MGHGNADIVGYDVRRMENVNLSFRYTQMDYVKAMRAHYASRLRLPLDIAAVFGAAALGAYELWSGSHITGVVMLALAGFFVMMLLAAFFVIPVLTFRSEPRFRDEYALSFSQQGIHFRTAHIDSDLQWTLYTRVLVDASSFILYYGSRQFTVVPRRAFQDDAQRLMFERMLAKHAAKVVDRTK